MSAKNAANQLARECIVTALLQLLKEKPLSALSISEITSRAGVSRMTYYRNYKSKEDIFGQALSDILDEYHREFQALSDGHSHYGDYANLLHCFTYFEKHRDFIYSLFRCGLGNLLLTSLSDYITNTWYHPESGDTIEDFYVLQAFTGSLYSTYVSWAVRGKKETPQQLAQVLSELYAKKR